MLPRQIKNLDESPPGCLLQWQPQRLGGVKELSGSLLERDDEPALSAFRAFENELKSQRTLPAARAAGNERDASCQQSAAQQRVEPSQSGRQPPREVQWRRGRTGKSLGIVSRKHRNSSSTDDHVVPAFEVSGVPQLVDFNVPLPLEALLRRGEKHHPIDDRLLDPEATDLRGAVGNVGREQTHRLGVLNDAGELKDFLPADLGILDLVQKDRNRV